MDIYVRLFYNNIESFCAQRFKRTKTILGAEAWHSLIRDFVHLHQCKSPYFSQISEEFIAFLVAERKESSDPPFLTELCHYEWVPLFLDRSAEELGPLVSYDDPLETELALSPLALVNRYAWPVDEISSEHQPEVEPANPTWVLAFRDRLDRVLQYRVLEPIGLMLADLFTGTPLQVAAENVFGNKRLENASSRANLVEQLKELLDAGALIVKSN